MIGGQKAAVQVSQGNADSRILKDGSPPLLAFPKGIFSTLPLLKIGICSVPLRDFPRSVAQRTTAKEKPAKFAVEAAEAALHFVRLYRIQSFPECVQNSWQVVGMNRNLPSRAQSLLCRQTRIVQPALIEKLCRAVWTSGPRQRRDGVDYKANVLYISRFFEAMPQGCHKDVMRGV